MYVTSELMVPAVVQLQRDNDIVSPSPTTFGKRTECLEIVPGTVQMPQGTARPGSTHSSQGSMKPQLSTSISSLEPATECDTSSLL